MPDWGADVELPSSSGQDQRAHKRLRPSDSAMPDISELLAAKGNTPKCQRLPAETKAANLAISTLSSSASEKEIMIVASGCRYQSCHLERTLSLSSGVKTIESEPSLAEALTLGIGILQISSGGC